MNNINTYLSEHSILLLLYIKMLKKIYKKNGIIIVSENDNDNDNDNSKMKIYYALINNILTKDFYTSLGYLY